MPIPGFSVDMKKEENDSTLSSQADSSDGQTASANEDYEAEFMISDSATSEDASCSASLNEDTEIPRVKKNGGKNSRPCKSQSAANRAHDSKGTRSIWSDKENIRLCQLVGKYKQKHWKLISKGGAWR